MFVRVIRFSVNEIMGAVFYSYLLHLIYFIWLVAGGVLYILSVNGYLHLNFMFAYPGGIDGVCNHIAGILTQFHSAYDAYVIYCVFLCLRIINNLCALFYFCLCFSFY